MKKIMLGVAAVAVAFSMYGTTALAAEIPQETIPSSSVDNSIIYGDYGYYNNNNYGYGYYNNYGYCAPYQYNNRVMNGRYYGGCCGRRGWY